MDQQQSPVARGRKCVQPLQGDPSSGNEMQQTSRTAPLAEIEWMGGCGGEGEEGGRKKSCVDALKRLSASRERIQNKLALQLAADDESGAGGCWGGNRALATEVWRMQACSLGSDRQRHINLLSPIHLPSHSQTHLEPRFDIMYSVLLCYSGTSHQLRCDTIMDSTSPCPRIKLLTPTSRTSSITLHHPSPSPLHNPPSPSTIHRRHTHPPNPSSPPHQPLGHQPLPSAPSPPKPHPPLPTSTPPLFPILQQHQATQQLSQTSPPFPPP